MGKRGRKKNSDYGYVNSASDYRGRTGHSKLSDTGVGVRGRIESRFDPPNVRRENVGRQGCDPYTYERTENSFPRVSGW